MSLEVRLEELVANIAELASNLGCASGFFIGNTAKFQADEYLFTPLRRSAAMVAGSVVVGSVGAGKTAAAALDGSVDYVVVDAEKKIDPTNYGEDDVGNLERVVREACTKSKVLTFKANDLAAESLDLLIASLANDETLGSRWPVKTAVVGAGNIGFKLALRLVERGHEVWLFRRDQVALNLIVDAINELKPRYTLASARAALDAESCATDADLLVGLSNDGPSISSSLIDLASDNAVFIDGGKGTFSGAAVNALREQGKRFLRADIQNAVGGLIDNLLVTEKVVSQSMVRRKVNGYSIVGSGVYAFAGEVVVDSGQFPQTVYGISDGFGQLVADPDEDQVETIEIIRAMVAAGKI